MALAREGVSSVIDLRREGERKRWPGSVSVEVCGLAEYAAPPVAELRAIADQVSTQIAMGSTVFVHCREGIQRAPMVACAVLVRSGWPLAAAARLILERRPATAMSEAQLGVLRELAGGR